ncbi:MAG: hypothetical protein EHM12_02060 [Dehalococcoidia bacterium]|nr:MAG: hypothetical protein EHM12_02060 [Dehalococcoidia bacterium]
MFKHLKCSGFAVMIGLIAVLAMVMPVCADDTPGITATINIVGENPDTNVNLYGNNPDVWINGYGLGELSYGAGYQGGASAASNASQYNSVNNQYSSSSTGMLPIPNITSDGRVSDINSPDTKWVPGWQGYFCPKSNEDITVYKGGGCGGTWGVCDGYPDMWVRRQIAGLAPEFRQQQAKLQTSIVAISRLITETQQHGNDLEFTNAALQQNLEQLAEVSVNLAILEKKHNELEAMVAQQKEDSDRRCAYICIAFGAGMLAILGYLVALACHNSPRIVRSEQKESARIKGLIVRRLGR